MRSLLITANLLIPVAVLIFASGFFPYKPIIQGLAAHDHLSQYGSPPQRQFDRLIFMVVDALRSDFVFSSASGFTFTQKLIRDGNAMPFTANANSPTITMPRVKAMTTGSVPSFLDVILNFAESDTTSTLANQDSWLAQIRAGVNRTNDGRLVMYGDDTWLKLFPGMFHRSDGTSSFFVSDFTEVDQNVTRHLPKQLKTKSHWDAMIMHYLGLDHIGHKAGPYSPNMVPKHMEMDDIVRGIYNSILGTEHLKSTLFILLGDHGMNDAGNHGGSSPGETSPALVFISPKLRTITKGRRSPISRTPEFTFYKRVEQSDLVPTITGLLGLPIPKNNLGIFIPDFLPLWKNPSDRLQHMLRNAHQILKIVKAKFPSVSFDSVDENACQSGRSSAEGLDCRWQKTMAVVEKYDNDPSNLKSVLGEVYSWCKDAQDVMSSVASNYNMLRLFLGIALAGIAVSSCLSYMLLEEMISPDSLTFFGIVTSFSSMMFASSYVEEEQRFWYWITGVWTMYLICRRTQVDVLRWSETKSRPIANIGAVMICHRILQRWNQTGQKHASNMDIVKGILHLQPVILWVLFALTYAVVAIRLGALGSRFSLMVRIPVFIAAFAVSVASMGLKLAFTANDVPELFYLLQGSEVEQLQQLPMLSLGRGVFVSLGLGLVWLMQQAWSRSISRKDFLSDCHNIVTLFLMTQSRTHNIPLYLLFLVQHHALKRMNLSPAQISISSLILAHASFFALGNSNAISSIDLSNGYNGVSGYNVVAVGLLVFASNWAGPIFWSVSAVALMARTVDAVASAKSAEALVGEEQKILPVGKKRDAGAKQATSTMEKARRAYSEHMAIGTFFTAFSVLGVMVACAVLRQHLFIWTVFSPKYLYSMAWSLGYHFAVTLALGGGLWTVAGNV